jgi:hypothetical protein
MAILRAKGLPVYARGVPKANTHDFREFIELETGSAVIRSPLVVIT